MVFYRCDSTHTIIAPPIKTLKRVGSQSISITIRLLSFFLTFYFGKEDNSNIENFRVLFYPLLMQQNYGFCFRVYFVG
jgi:hypothetical protein